MVSSSFYFWFIIHFWTATISSFSNKVLCLGHLSHYFLRAMDRNHVWWETQCIRPHLVFYSTTLKSNPDVGNDVITCAVINVRVILPFLSRNRFIFKTFLSTRPSDYTIAISRTPKWNECKLQPNSNSNQSDVLHQLISVYTLPVSPCAGLFSLSSCWASMYFQISVTWHDAAKLFYHHYTWILVIYSMNFCAPKCFHCCLLLFYHSFYSHLNPFCFI